MGGDDVLDAMRRSELLDRVNEDGNDAVDQLGAMTEDLNIQEANLNEQLAEQEDVVEQLDARQEDMLEALDAAEEAEQELRERLERERRAAEAAERLRRARAAAASSRSAPAAAAAAGGGGGSSAPAVVIGSGSWICPVQGGVSFSDTWGAARSGGRRHQGTDMMAASGTPVVAVVSGTVSHRSGGLAGNAAYLNGSDGNTYFYAHLQRLRRLGIGLGGNRHRDGRQHRQRPWGCAAPSLRDPSRRRRRNEPVLNTSDRTASASSTHSPDR